jgi:multicomponent Na+:H+ antiporter subunit D
MIGEVSPGLILILGALLVPLLRGHLRSAYMLALPIVAFWYLLGLDHGAFGQIDAAGVTLVTLRVDKLSLVFGYIFLIAAFLGVLYALHVDDTLQHVAGLIYAGSAVGAVFAGDLITLFIFWEGIAIASVFLIWATRTERAYRAGRPD